MSRRDLLPIVMIFVIACAMLLPTLGDAPLAGTEGHRALSAHRMVETGQWLVPELYGRTYLRKPPLHYWLIAGAESLVGHGNELIWRLPTVLEYALMASLMAWAGGRLFGPRGAWVSGVSLLAIVPLWAQARTADIDTLNNLTATATATAIVLLIDDRTRRRWLCVALGGVALGACLMTKGPAGLPIVLGASAAVLIVSAGDRFRTLVRLAGLWLIGIAIFASYVIAVIAWLNANGRPLDFSGVSEGLGNARPDNLARLLAAFLVPLKLVLFALPTSIALAIVLRPVVRSTMEPGAARVALVIGLSLLCAWLVQLLTGMHNERYGYPTLPLMALLPAVVLTQLGRYSARQRAQLRWILFGVVLAWGAGTMGLIAMAWAEVGAQLELIMVGLMSLGMTAWTVSARTTRRTTRRATRRLAGMLVLVPLMAIPFGIWNNAQRFERSGLLTAPVLRDVIGPGNRCVVGAMLRYKPELFYYSGVEGLAYREDIPRPEELTDSTWLLLTDEEFQTLYAPVRQRLSVIVPLESDGKGGYIVFFEKPAGP